MAHVLVLASHYLAIRLPAEITLPHKDYPRPTIFPIDASYEPGEAQFPASQQPPMQLDPRKQGQARSRPRPLFLDKPLVKLARDDPSAYSLFLEGVSLLAYNIVWACKSQGVHAGDEDSIEDFCNFGRNLYNLLIGNFMHTNSAGRIIYQASSASNPVNGGAGGVDNGGKSGDMVMNTTVGRFSHGAAHNNFLSADGTEFLRRSKPKLPSPIKVADKLKRKLNPTSEWEMLEIPDNLEDTVMVNERGPRSGQTRARERRTSFGIESLMSEIDPAAGNDAVDSGGGQAGNGASPKTNATGWTRFRHR